MGEAGDRVYTSSNGKVKARFSFIHDLVFGSVTNVRYWSIGNRGLGMGPASSPGFIKCGSSATKFMERSFPKTVCVRPQWVPLLRRVTPWKRCTDRRFLGVPRWPEYFFDSTSSSTESAPVSESPLYPYSDVNGEMGELAFCRGDDHAGLDSSGLYTLALLRTASG